MLTLVLVEVMAVVAVTEVTVDEEVAAGEVITAAVAEEEGMVDVVAVEVIVDVVEVVEVIVDLAIVMAAVVAIGMVEAEAEASTTEVGESMKLLVVL